MPGITSSLSGPNTHSFASVLAFKTRKPSSTSTIPTLTDSCHRWGQRLGSVAVLFCNHTSGVGNNHGPEKGHYPPPRPVPDCGWMVSMITSVISLRPRCWWRMAARSPGPFPSKQEGTATGAAPVLSAAISGAAQEKGGVGTGWGERSPGTGTHRQHRDDDPRPLPSGRLRAADKAQLPPPLRRAGLTRTGAQFSGNREPDQTGETHQPRCKRSPRAAASARPAPAGSPPETRSWARTPRAGHRAPKRPTEMKHPLPPPAPFPFDLNGVTPGDAVT